MNEEKPNISDLEFEKLTREELIAQYRKLSAYTTSIEEREKKHLMEIAKLKNIILMNYANPKEFEANVFFFKKRMNKKFKFHLESNFG